MITMEYRVRDLEYNKFIFANGVFIQDGIIHVVEYINGVYEGYVVPNGVINRFTGIYDRNGRKIFDRDICRYHILREEFEPPELNIGEVFWDAEHPGFFIGKDEFDFLEVNRYEVIGNMYDNPSLLKNYFKFERLP